LNVFSFYLGSFDKIIVLMLCFSDIFFFFGFRSSMMLFHPETLLSGCKTMLLSS
jgi:hypothetical protein